MIKYSIRELTATHASSEELEAWLKTKSSGKIGGDNDKIVGENHALQPIEGATSTNNSGIRTISMAKPMIRCTRKDKYSFICECFFMTARVLNLGLMKALSDFKQIAQVRSVVLDFFFTHSIFALLYTFCSFISSYLSLFLAPYL